MACTNCTLYTTWIIILMVYVKSLRMALIITQTNCVLRISPHSLTQIWIPPQFPGMLQYLRVLNGPKKKKKNLSWWVFMWYCSGEWACLLFAAVTKGSDKGNHGYTLFLLHNSRWLPVEWASAVLLSFATCQFSKEEAVSQIHSWTDIVQRSWFDIFIHTLLMTA